MAKYFRECQKSSTSNVGARSKASSYCEASAWYLTHLYTYFLNSDNCGCPGKLAYEGLIPQGPEVNGQTNL